MKGCRLIYIPEQDLAIAAARDEIDARVRYTGRVVEEGDTASHGTMATVLTNGFQVGKIEEV